MNLRIINILALSKEFSVLFTWAYVELHILCMTGAKDKAIKLALHMDSLGWMDDERRQMVTNACGDVFMDNKLHLCFESIRHYAVQTLKEALVSENVLDKKDIEELQQLLKEMKTLGWFNPKDYNEKQLERLHQMGIDITNY